MKDGLQITDQTDLKEWNLGGRLFGFVYRKGFGMIQKKCESICQKWQMNSTHFWLANHGSVIRYEDLLVLARNLPSVSRVHLLKSC